MTPKDQDPARFSPEQHALLMAHYERVTPLLVASFGGTPLVAGFVHDWATKAMTYEESVTAPKTIATISVPLRAGPAPFATVAANTILWQAHRGAISLLGWSPTPADPARVAFGRIILEPCGIAAAQMVKDGAVVFRDLLSAAGLRSIVLLNGDGGLALWIPFSDAPAFDAVRARLDALASEAATAHPSLLTTAHPLSERGDRVHVACGSNAVGRFSALPYSLRARDELQVFTPIGWSELAEMNSGDVTAANFPTRLASHGDVFAKEVSAIGAQPSSDFLSSARQTVRNSILLPIPLNGEPRGRIIQAAIAILDDGKPRDADAILAEAIARDLIPKTTTRKDVYTELIEYISRAKGHDRKPKITQDIDRKFRRNLPADDWPSPKESLPTRSPAPGSDELAARLIAAGAGDDPAAYEQAVCDTFAACGLIATHVGGEEATDGFADAPLGVFGYRVMLECKRALKIVQEPDAAEAAKYVSAYGAQYAALIGPAFGDDVQLAEELQTHGVTAFTNDDLVELLKSGTDPNELHAIFAVPGFAAEKIEETLWLRDHGARKRLAVICETLRRTGLEMQRVSAKSGDFKDAPRLDVDAAMLLVDSYVLNQEGSQSPCTRAEVEAAFAYLTSPLVGAASWIDDAKISVVITG